MIREGGDMEGSLGEGVGMRVREFGGRKKIQS